MPHRVQQWSTNWDSTVYVCEWLEQHLQYLGLRRYTGNMHQMSVNSFAKGIVNNESSENASISGTISHHCDNQLSNLCALCRPKVVMSVYQHGHPWLLVWEVDVVASKSSWLLRFPLSHLCVHWNQDNKLIALQVDPVLITVDLNALRSETVFFAW